ncbi:MAG TPA: signal peptidase I [Bdellovibrionales bacterium]|nr:signal peptidase I [Bdellovibrionales bacterium]
MSSTDTSKRQVTFLFRYALQSFAVVLIVAILLRTFFFSSYAMSGWSMLPNVWPGDFLLASQWRAQQHMRRGEIVALRCPYSREQLCLKRVVGLPGDRIEFQDRHLVINGQPARYQEISAEISQETAAGKSWLVWPDSAAETAPALVVPPDQIYLLNDKRSDREDSRKWGPVPKTQIESRVLGVWLSLDWFEGEAVRSWPRVRWNRMLRSID